MKLWALGSYRCPITGERLRHISFEEESVVLSENDRGLLVSLGFSIADFECQIRTGILVSEASGYWYPIYQGVPVLLDFRNGFGTRFKSENSQHRRAWQNLREPDARPRPGELLTQKSFTAEWETLQEDDHLSFTYSQDERREFIRLELGWPRPIPPDPHFKTFDVGCGSGLESMVLAQVTERMVFGIDLNTSIIRMAPRLKTFAFVHNAIASVFAPPFAPESFDLIYSHGVLHHTYNTQRAFASARKLAAADADVYIWVYALEDSQRGKLGKKFEYLAELLLRPKIARLPAPIQNLVVKALAFQHYRQYRRNGLKKDVWHFRHSEHSMRDRWTCRYAHRHSFHEVIEWFLSAGYECRLVDPVEYRRRFHHNLIGIGILGKKPNRLPFGKPAATCSDAALPSA